MSAKHVIQELRGKGWSDAAIARAVGCSQPTITRIRNGKSNPRESTAISLQNLRAAQDQPAHVPLSCSGGACPTPG